MKNFNWNTIFSVIFLSIFFFGCSSSNRSSRSYGPSPPCEKCTELEGFIDFEHISKTLRMMVGKSRGNKEQAVEIQKKRGVIETGLTPVFIGGARCPEIDSEEWAIDYSHKRPWSALHKGVDIPEDEGTPVRAIADGVVVGKFMNTGNRKGIEIVLRHIPKQTGLPYWTYSQYTHLLELPPLKIGAHVRIGEEVGKTSNTGEMGRRIRRDALHFAILYSERPEWSNDGRVVIPQDGFWMDPNAFYRSGPPYESQEILKLPAAQKNVPVPHMQNNGSLTPPNTKRIWPYLCE